MNIPDSSPRSLWLAFTAGVIVAGIVVAAAHMVPWSWWLS